MIVSKTPLRISFSGGGTDIESYYSSNTGIVISSTINKYIYVTVKKHTSFFNEKIRLNYSEVETVNSVDDIVNDIARECIKFLKIDSPLYISTIADLPSGSGLGSSSSFAVGLLNALHAYNGNSVSSAQLAEEAAYIEIRALKANIGKQDQYSASFGGLNKIIFNTNGHVSIEPYVAIEKKIFNSLMLFWTGISRDASAVLESQDKNKYNNKGYLDEIKSCAYEMNDMLLTKFSLEHFGSLLHKNWENKRKLSDQITDSKLDEYYQLALNAGAIGGKLLGAGGGGFFAFVVPEGKRDSVRRALSKLNELCIEHEPIGSSIILNE